MEKSVFLKQVYGLGLGPVPPDAEWRFVFTFDKPALVWGKVLRVYFFEKGAPGTL